MNKTLKVEEHLKHYGSITSLEAIELYKATRLSAIIFNLRKRYLIDTKWATSVDEDGTKCRYGIYTLRDMKE